MADLLDETLDGDPGDADATAAAPAFAPGTMIGHFRIVRELGAGAMGVVFEAYDPDLDRRVAIKVVRGQAADSAAGARLIREAQAMARLSHPNVVGVHEVGTIDGRVFVVMELVRGRTLAAWLDEDMRSWRQIVEVFAQAGDGLVAAHEAGLVHRDFKPSNVLLDRAGRARVTDFGLAFSDDEPRLALGSTPVTSSVSGRLNRSGFPGAPRRPRPDGDRLASLVGGPVGTPAYMAPEQRAGGAVDARADQYAFAVSLQDALGPKHAIGTAPRRIRAAVARGLSIDPDARFASVSALLVELRRALRSRRRALIAGGVLAAGVASAALGFAGRRIEDACATGAALVDEVWDPAARGELTTQLAIARPDGAVLVRSTTRVVDDWVAAWKLGRRGACTADEEQRRARLVCLDRNLEDLRQQLAVWHTASPDVADRAVDAALALPHPNACAAVAPEREEVPPVIVERAARIHALARAGRSRDAAPEAAQLVTLAEATGAPAALAVAGLAFGTIARANGQLEPARAALARAAADAGRAGADDIMVEAMLVQATVVIEQGRPLDSLGLLEAAAAIAARVGIDRPERVALARGDALVQAGRVPEGLAELRRAVRMLEERAARDPSAELALARGLGALATAYNMGHDNAQSRELLVRALAIEEATLGADHVEVGKTLHDLGTNETRLGHHAEAIARLERARAIFVRALGAEHAFVGGADVSLALVAVIQGRFADATRLYQRALAVLRRVLPADHPHLAIVEQGLGTIERDQDRCAAAIPHFERATAIVERLGRGGTELATNLVNLGACLSDVGRRAEARPLLERGLALLDAAQVAERDKAEARLLLAELDTAAGKRDAAMALYRRVLATTRDEDGPVWVQYRTYAREQLASLSAGR